ncbi:hypothetical protein KZZ08_15045 [Roseovarius mucosus]|uniref:hypothetical protein n=1 Tax=Roseovarius mucosus TaxID=215743 RepID=UPI001C5CCF53|nr:hypothetical protein [Roseovarius mucosus]MBW4974948.1 hypothetical protein [Roseovarius mucosus]
MSDPVTNVEIEDVLSSIRRLVSNGQAERLSTTVAAPREAGMQAADRLVLTPALRVDEPVAEPPAEAVDAEEPDAHNVWTGTDLSEHETDIKDESAPEGIETEFSETDQTPDLPSELSAQAAEFEAMIAGRDDQWEPDGASDDDYAGGAAESVLSWSETDEPEGDEEAELDEAETAPSVDPDWDESDDLASERHVQDWQDADAADLRPAPDADADRGEGLLMDDAVLDEEALRDLVAEIVRQELQGALGERITRNVRKLVRREIHRALTSQDFD